MNYSVNITTCNEDEQGNASLQKKNILREETSLVNNSMKKKKQKSKSKQKDKQMLKKEAYKLRAKVISEDLKPFNFSKVNLTDDQINITGMLQNEDLYDNKITFSKSPQKRSREQTMEKDNKVKRKRQNVSCV